MARCKCMLLRTRPNTASQHSSVTNPMIPAVSVGWVADNDTSCDGAEHDSNDDVETGESREYSCAEYAHKQKKDQVNRDR